MPSLQLGNTQQNYFYSSIILIRMLSTESPNSLTWISEEVWILLIYGTIPPLFLIYCFFWMLYHSLAAWRLWHHFRRSPLCLLKTFWTKSSSSSCSFSILWALMYRQWRPWTPWANIPLDSLLSGLISPIKATLLVPFIVRKSLSEVLTLGFLSPTARFQYKFLLIQAYHAFTKQVFVSSWEVHPLVPIAYHLDNSGHPLSN